MPELIVKLGDKLVQRYVFDKDVISIGRARDNDIVIENLSVSRNHARIRRADGKFILTDLNSANGTMVNMVRVTKHEIVDGDLVQIGKHTLAFSTKESSPIAEPPPPAAKPGSMQTVQQPSGGMASVGMASVGAGGAGGDADLPNPGMVCVVKGKQVDQKFRVGRRETTIGRANDNDVRLFDWFVSKKHAQIVRRDNGFYLKDLQSWRGTTVNGQNVRSEVQLKEGDEITLGTTVLRFSDRIPPELEAELAAQAAVAAKARVLSDDDAIAGDDMPPPDYATKNIDPASREDVVAGVAGYRQPKSGDTVPVKSAAENPWAQPQQPPQQERDEPPPPPQGTAPLDEFSPISEAELEALEAEADAVIPADQMDQLVRQEWENFEMENMASMGERIEESKRVAEEKKQQAEEEKGFRSPTESIFDQTGAGFTSQELEIEEKALFGEAPEPEKAKPVAASKPTAPAPAPAAAVAVAGPAHFTASDTPLPIANMDQAEREAQIKLWTRALKNPSEMIRAYAEKELRKLTGQHHDQQ